MKKQKKESVSEKLAKKSVIFKPFVFNHLYNTLPSKRKEVIDSAIEKFEGNVTNERKLFLQKDIAYSMEVYNSSAKEYFLYNLEKKKESKRREFVFNKNRQQYLYLLGTEKGQRILLDKYESYKLLKKYYKRDLIYIRSMDDSDIFQEFVKKYPKFVKKPIDASFGKGVELIDIKKEKNNKKLFTNLLKEAPLVLEEQIISDKKIASLHPESLNTIRIVTYKDLNNKVHIHLPFIKIGRGDSFVDNGGAGGLLARIDAKTGIIITDAKDELNNIYKNHPDTNVKIKGFKIPKWDEMIKLVTDAALDFEETRYIGWDVALSIDKGPVIVEGNGKTQFFGQQMVDEVGKRIDLEKLIDYKGLKKQMKDVKYWEIPVKKRGK